MPTIPTQVQQIGVLQGKIVDGEEMVRAAEVPFGGYGIFPKADLSEVFVKSWNSNGTTQITTYHPMTVINKDGEEGKQEDIYTLLLNKIESIEEKINSMSAGTAVKEVQAPIQDRKEALTSAF